MSVAFFYLNRMPGQKFFLYLTAFASIIEALKLMRRNGEKTMPNLETEYAGLRLRNPIIIAPAAITETVERMKKCEQYGAGAVVVKSLFENEITRKTPTPCFKIIERSVQLQKNHTLYSYEQASIFDPKGYAGEIEKAKKSLSIPVIASINCETENAWRSYAKMMQEAGADAIEINLSCPHFSITFTGDDVERNMLGIYGLVAEAVNIPVIPKISGQLTSPLATVRKLKEAGAGAVVLFNRFTGLDIDIEREVPIMHGGYAGHGGAWSIHYPLRWVSAISPAVDIEIGASGGASSAQDVVKYLLCGARTVQACTVVIVSGYRAIRDLVRGLEEFMNKKGYSAIEDFRGAVCSKILKYDEVDRSDRVRAEIIEPRCKGCGECFNVCIYGAIDKEKKLYSVNDRCVGCGLCAELCPVGAIKMTER